MKQREIDYNSVLECFEQDILCCVDFTTKEDHDKKFEALTGKFMWKGRISELYYKS